MNWDLDGSAEVLGWGIILRWVCIFCWGCRTIIQTIVQFKPCPAPQELRHPATSVDSPLSDVYRLWVLFVNMLFFTCFTSHRNNNNNQIFFSYRLFNVCGWPALFSLRHVISFNIHSSSDQPTNCSPQITELSTMINLCITRSGNGRNNFLVSSTISCSSTIIVPPVQHFFYCNTNTPGIISQIDFY